MQWGAAFLFSILLLLGALVIADRKPPPPPPAMEMVATRDIGNGALLLPGDVAPRRDAPQYALRAIKAKEAIKAGDLSGAPPVAWDDTAVPVVFNVTRGLIDGRQINAGAKARICKEKETSVEAVTVKTVLCAPEQPSCLAVVMVAADKAAALGQAFTKAPLPRLQPADVKPPCSGD